MMDLVVAMRRNGFNWGFFQNMKTFRGRTESVKTTLVNTGYTRLLQSDQVPLTQLDLTELTPPLSSKQQQQQQHKQQQQQQPCASPDSAIDCWPSLGDNSDDDTAAAAAAAADNDDYDYGYDNEDDDGDDSGGETDDYDIIEDEDRRTCVVCDVTFDSRHQLVHHQKRKQHYGCAVCEDAFPTRAALHFHKQNTDHWTLSDDSDDDSDDDSEEGEGGWRDVGGSSYAGTMVYSYRQLRS